MLTITADTFDEAIRLLRTKHGESQGELAAAVTRAGIPISRDIIQRLEMTDDKDRSITEEKADPLVVAAIAQHYDVATSKLSKLAATRMAQRQSLLRTGSR